MNIISINQVYEHILALRLHNSIKKKYNEFARKFADTTNGYRNQAMNYISKMRKGINEYAFSNSYPISSIYSSTYGCLIEAMLKKLSDSEKDDWKDYFDSKQREDGFYYDSNYKDNEYFCGTDGWGARHLIPHITIAFDRIDRIPKYEFSFIEELRDPDTALKWISNLDYKKIWATSNEIMNYCVTMQYSRDRLGLPYAKSIEAIEEYLINRINPKYGMWYEGKIECNYHRYEMIRGAYHILPILYYDNILDKKYAETAISEIVKSQNKWGGFDGIVKRLKKCII